MYGRYAHPLHAVKHLRCTVEQYSRIRATLCLMDKAEIRREYLRSGGDIRATARTLGISRPTVYRALASLPPLTVDDGTVNSYGIRADPDALAVHAYIRACLDRAGILKDRPTTAVDLTPPSRSP